MQLVDAHLQARREDFYMIGVSVNAAMSDKPSEALGRILKPVKTLTYDDVPPMLRAPRKRTPTDAT